MVLPSTQQTVFFIPASAAFVPSNFEMTAISTKMLDMAQVALEKRKKVQSLDQSDKNPSNVGNSFKTLKDKTAKTILLIKPLLMKKGQNKVAKRKYNQSTGKATKQSIVLLPKKDKWIVITSEFRWWWAKERSSPSEVSETQF